MAQLVKTMAGLAIASVKTVNGLAIASVKTVAGLDNTSGDTLWINQPNSDDNFSISSSQICSQGIQVSSAVTITRLKLELKSLSATSTVRVQFRTAQNGGGSTIGVSCDVVVTSTQSVYEFVFGTPVALSTDCFLNVVSLDNGANIYIKSGDPYAGTSYAAWQAGSVFSSYDFRMEVWKQ